MNRDNDRQTSIILAVLGILPIVWLRTSHCTTVKGGLPEILPSLMNVMSDPFHIVLCEDSVKNCPTFWLLCYGMGIGIYFSTRRNYRRERTRQRKWAMPKPWTRNTGRNPPSETS